MVSIAGVESTLTERADLVIPGLTFAEKDGLIVNFEGHVQRLRPGVQPRAESEWKVLVSLLASFDGGEAVEFISHVRKALVETESVFEGVDLMNVGAHGLRLSGQPVG